MEMANKILSQLAIWRIDSKNFIQAWKSKNNDLYLEQTKVFANAYDILCYFMLFYFML